VVKIRKIIILIAFLIVAFLFAFSQVYAYTEITNCTNITQPGEYRLVNDIITGYDVQLCIDIQSDNVIFDCQGHIISVIAGPTIEYYRGIDISGRSNVTIKNCVIKNWGTGIIIDSSSYIILNNITVNVTKRAIYLNGASYSTLSNIVVHDSSYGPFIFNGSYITISDVVANRCNFGGVEIEYSNSVVLTNIFTNDSSYDGVYVGESTNVTVINVTSTYDSYGVHFSYSNNCAAINIRANYEYYSGIYIEFTDGSYFEGITINSSAEESYSYGGIYTWESNNNTFYNFYIFNLTGDGISINYNSYGNEFKNGIIENVSGNGINIDSSGNNTFHNIIIKNSDKCGIYLSSSGYNLFYNNIFMNRNNTCFADNIYPNYWNTTLTSDTNIVGGPYIGGNYWGSPDGTGYSDTCVDANYDGICDNSYTLATDNIDYLSLAKYVGPYCGNGICEPGEDYNTCPADCPAPTTTTTTIPSYGLIATARAIARINPFALFILVLIPVIIGEFVIKSFEEIKVNEPLKAAIRLLILIISLALLAAVF